MYNKLTVKKILDGAKVLSKQKVSVLGTPEDPYIMVVHPAESLKELSYKDGEVFIMPYEVGEYGGFFVKIVSSQILSG